MIYLNVLKGLGKTPINCTINLYQQYFVHKYDEVSLREIVKFNPIQARLMKNVFQTFLSAADTLNYAVRTPNSFSLWS